MTEIAPVVFLLDVDNTLLDNDQVIEDLRSHLTQAFGAASQQRYWTIYEKLRSELGYADYLGRCSSIARRILRDPHFLKMSFYLLDYPFATRLFPGALALIAHLRHWGPTVIFSDGDVVFQPRKIDRSGLWQAVDGNVLIYIHKEQELDDVLARYPADHYVMVDDKLRILAALKEIWGAKLTTVFVRQGHYAHDIENLAKYPPADVTIEHIADLIGHDLTELLAAGTVKRETGL